METRPQQAEYVRPLFALDDFQQRHRRQLLLEIMAGTLLAVVLTNGM